jgi:hypothetical protein
MIQLSFFSYINYQEDRESRCSTLLVKSRGTVEALEVNDERVAIATSYNCY